MQSKIFRGKLEKLCLLSASSFLLVFFYLFLPPTANASAIAKPSNNLGLMGYWSFNDGTSTKATDSSGKGNTGTLTAGPVWASGKFGKAVSFTGASSQYVSIPDTSSIRVASGDFTIATWINPTTLSSGDTVFSKVNSGGSIRELYFTFLSSTSVFMHIGESNAGTEILSTGFSNGSWQHLTVTRSGSSVTIYRNGVSVSTATMSGTTTNTSAFRIGGRAPDPDGNNFWSGGIDEFRVYNRALGSTEITALYNAGATKSIVATNTGLVGYWSLDDASGTKATDSSGQRNAATLTNGPAWIGGKLGKALSFDGINDYVNIPNVTPIAGTGSYTIGAWVNLSSFPTSTNSKYIFSKGSDVPSSGWGMQLVEFNNGGLQQWGVSVVTTVPSTFQYNVYGGAPLLNTWTHIVGVYNSATQKALLYVDGAFIGQLSTGTVLRHANASLIGIGANLSTSPWPGMIDDVRIYNRALSAAEITTLYSAGETKINSSTNAQLTNGLVGLWSFNGQDIRGTTAYDRSGQNNTGTISGGPVPISGKLGQALSFDGVDDYVDAGNGSALNPTTAISACAWINSTNPTVSAMIINKDNSGSFQYTLRMNGTTGKVMFRATNSGLTSAEADGNTVLSANTWYFSCGTYDGSNVRIFIDGVEDGTAGSLTGTMSNNGANLTIGRRDDGFYFPGKIDDVRIYNRVLSSAEVLQLYAMGK